MKLLLFSTVVTYQDPLDSSEILAREAFVISELKYQCSEVSVVQNS